MLLRAAVVAAILFASPINADTSHDDSIDLSPVVVTATRTAVSSDDVLVPVIVIAREEIERSQATDVAGLLRFHGGIEVARNGGPGQLTSVFIRGAESDHTLVLIDGVRINSGTTGAAALQNISPDLVDRIEIVKGPRSALYGSEAIGGVINIITRGAEAPLSISAEAGAGQYSTRRAAGQAAWKGNTSSAGLNVSWLDSDGFPTFEASPDDAGYDNTSFNLWTKTRIAAIDVAASHWQSTGTTEYSDFFLAPVDQDYTNKSSQLVIGASPLDSWRTQLSVSKVIDDIEQGNGAFNPSDFTKTDRIAADWQNTLTFDRGLNLVAGLYRSEEKTSGIVFGSRLEDKPGAGDVQTDNTAGYLQTSARVGRQNFLLAGRYTDHDEFGTENSWNTEYGFDFAHGFRFSAGAGRGFRAPSSLDLYGFGGNSDLNPEVSRNLEFAVTKNIGEDHTFRIGYFRNRIKDLINFVVTDPDTFAGENQNIEKASIRGTELSYRFEGQSWRFRSEITIQDPKDRISNEQLLRRAKNMLTMSIGRKFGEHALGIDILATDKRVDFGGARLAGYVLANLNGRISLGRHWRLKAEIENLLDQDYQLAEGYRSAGRGLYATLGYTY
jgi:vitamin B12 transporter